jgi:hypothetical protein
MGIWVCISAGDALHTNQKIETAIGNQFSEVAFVTGILQILGASIEFYTVKIVFDDYRYVRELIMSRDDSLK